MTLQDLLKGAGIDLKKTKLIRHNLSRPKIAENVQHDLLEFYQAIQTPKLFQNADIILSFLGTERTNAVFLGCYKVGGSVPCENIEMPKKLVIGDTEGLVFYELEKVPILSELENRLVIDWGGAVKSWCQWGTNPKEVLEIRPKHSEKTFESYEKTILDFQMLNEIIRNPEANRDWERKLSAVAGVYIITDRKTGKQYVSSASGENGGIWGRWSNYVHTKHGGNVHLKKMIEKDPMYYQNFQFSILEVLPLRWNNQDVLEREELYKRKLMTREFGYNNN